MSQVDLLTIPTSEWETASAICLGWEDGPEEAIVRLSNPNIVFHAKLTALRATEEDLDERLFRATLWSSADFDQLMEVLRPVGPPRLPVWVPLWQFPTQASKDKAEAVIDGLITKHEPTFLIFTPDMKRFLGAWPIAKAGRETGAELFAKLGLPPPV